MKNHLAFLLIVGLTCKHYSLFIIHYSIFEDEVSINGEVVTVTSQVLHTRIGTER